MQEFTIKAFGMLAEKLPQPEFTFPYTKDTEQLLIRLQKEFPSLEPLQYSLAVDQELVRENRELKGNEEIALLPPFSGG